MFASEPLDPSVLAHSSDVSDEQRQWPAMLLELHGVIQATLDKHNIDTPELPLAMVLDISEYMGGMQVYMPRGVRLRQQIRDMEIWKAFNGSNVHQLARHYKVTDKTIYEVCRRMRKIEQQRRQPDLFG
ncbi:Mor transcription activator family protein [Moritella viscosa]